jgi:hypothetical protein
MTKNTLDADTVRRPEVHCTLGLTGRDSGICKSCKRPSAVLIGEHCPECMTPCDLKGACDLDLGPDTDDEEK